MTFRLPTKDSPATPGKCTCTAERDDKGRLAFKVNPTCPWVSGNSEPIRVWSGEVISYVPTEEAFNGPE